jgi:hypothetical protein
VCVCGVGVGGKRGGPGGRASSVREVQDCSKDDLHLDQALRPYHLWLPSTPAAACAAPPLPPPLTHGTATAGRPPAARPARSATGWAEGTARHACGRVCIRAQPGRLASAASVQRTFQRAMADSLAGSRPRRGAHVWAWQLAAAAGGARATTSSARGGRGGGAHGGSLGAGGHRFAVIATR